MHDDGDQPQCFHPTPSTLNSGTRKRRQKENRYHGRRFRALVYAVDRTNFPEAIAVSTEFWIRAAATEGNRKDKSSGADPSPRGDLPTGPKEPVEPMPGGRGGSARGGKAGASGASASAATDDDSTGTASATHQAATAGLAPSLASLTTEEQDGATRMP